jgi:hypothetical protein
LRDRAGRIACYLGANTAQELEAEILRLGAENVAAFIGEPVQGAGGVIIPPASYWPEIERICRKHDILLIADEVITGFGRTGNWFGHTTFGFTPDIVTLAKGNRSAQVRRACQTHGGFYLGSIGGPAARLAKDCIKKVEVLEYPELGMEAVWKIEVVDFPAFIVVDDKGNDFFAGIEGKSSGKHLNVLG